MISKQNEIGFLLMAEVRIYLSSWLPLGQCQWPEGARLIPTVDENHENCRRCQCHSGPAVGNQRPHAPGPCQSSVSPVWSFPIPYARISGHSQFKGVQALSAAAAPVPPPSPLPRRQHCVPRARPPCCSCAFPFGPKLSFQFCGCTLCPVELSFLSVW